MPLYEYQCDACGHRFEKIQKFSDPLIEECPNCGEKQVHKLVSSPAIQFKGTGLVHHRLREEKRGGRIQGGRLEGRRRQEQRVEGRRQGRRRFENDRLENRRVQTFREQELGRENFRHEDGCYILLRERTD